ncbi:MAG TPA: hypothetical protein VKO87_08070, partial [Gemmatimonadaceae bacterium]|nr:hypothetical protein [Gemmatimonadaceae bacterium]
MRKSLKISIALGTVGLGCFAAPSIPVAPSDAPIVVIGTASARFIFPRESTTVFSWDIPTNDSYEGSPEHVWSANWEIAEDRVGKDP